METKLTEKEELLLKEKIQEANDYKYAQSSNGSRLIRKIVFAIIGSCWILMFAQGKYQEANVFLKITITCSFIYLLLRCHSLFLGYLFLSSSCSKSGIMYYNRLP